MAKLTFSLSSIHNIFLSPHKTSALKEILVLEKCAEKCIRNQYVRFILHDLPETSFSFLIQIFPHFYQSILRKYLLSVLELFINEHLEK